MFADWLDEHADALPDPAAARKRAQFVRADIALSQLDEFDPLRLRWELLDKPRHESEPWANAALPPLPTGATFARDPLFRRGFPWAVVFPSASGPAVPARSEVAAPLEGIRIFQCSRFHHTVGALPRAPWWNRLRAIEFDRRGNMEPTDALAQFAPERLERVAFLNEAITAPEVRVLIASPLAGRFTALQLRRATVGTAVAEALVRESANLALRELYLFGCRVPWAPLEALLRSPVISSVHALALGGDGIGSPRKLQLFERLTAPALRALDFSDEVPSAEALAAFLASPIVPQLRRLDLSCSSLNRDRTQLLAGGAFTNLRVLRLYGNSVGNDGAAALARAPHLAGLLVLDLGRAQVGDEGVLAILESPLVDGLVLLDLTGSPASEETKELLVGRMGDRVRV